MIEKYLLRYLIYTQNVSKTPVYDPVKSVPKTTLLRLIGILKKFGNSLY